MINTVYLEDSNTPIYRRIAHALGTELTRCGMEVLIVNPKGFNATTFHDFVSRQGAAAYISSNTGNAIQTTIPGKDEYYFENFPGKLIFLHQDAILGGISLLAGISKLQAWQRVAERSAHLCIEPDSMADLASVGITNAAVVSHATEIEPVEPSVEGFQYGATFVGHAIPSIYRTPGVPQRIQSLIDDAIRLRCSDFSMPLENLVKLFSENALGSLGDPVDQALLKVACAQWLRNEITGQSLWLRGWVFENSAIRPLAIFGGDPAYIHGIERNLSIQGAGISHHPAIYDSHEVQQVFNKSKVSINITSLQFDHAVVNRFHDVIMSGGLCLTDARSGLEELTSAHAEVSWRTLEELRERTDYYSCPENTRQRSLLIKKVQQDIARNSGYPLLARAVIEAINGL